MRISFYALRLRFFGTRNANEIHTDINSLHGKIKKLKQHPHLLNDSSLSDLTTQKQRLLSSIKCHNKKEKHPNEAKFLTRSLSHVSTKIDLIKPSSQAQPTNKEPNSDTDSATPKPDISSSNKTTLKKPSEKLSYSSIKKDISSLQHRVNQYKTTSQRHEPKKEVSPEKLEEITTALLLIILDVNYLRSELTSKHQISSMNSSLYCLSVSVKKLTDKSKITF